MKFRNKLVIYIIVIIAIILSFSRYIVVRQNFMNSIENSAKQNISKYTLNRYILESNIVKNIQLGEKVTDEKIVEYVKELFTYIENGLDKIAIYTENAEEIFSNFENISDIKIKSILSQETDNYYIRQMGNNQYMIFSSYWEVDEEGRYIINAYDITSIFKERDRQMYEILFADIIILVISMIVIYVVSIFITNPIKKLNETSKKIAMGKFNERVEINNNDEIGELASSFNIMAEQVENKITQLNLSIQQKDDFITGFTHEIKNPMTIIVGYAELLKTRKCDEELTKKALNYIYMETKRIEKLSYKLMKLMSISEEKIEMQEIKVEEFISEVVENEEFVLEQIKLETNIQPAKIKADAELLEVVMKNIIENSKKAEPKDKKIVIEGKVIENNKYRIYVKDRGRGIPKEHINRVTESFYMVDKSRAKTNGGSGIGLALCKKILEVHNSKLQIESEEEIGTTVYFELEVI